MNTFTVGQSFFFKFDLGHELHLGLLRADPEVENIIISCLINIEVAIIVRFPLELTADPLQHKHFVGPNESFH